jgi:O-antigen/teichoic acid export membrane protein
LHFKITATAAVVNLGLNLLVIPIYGAWGAIATTLGAEFVVLVLVLFARFWKGLTFPSMFTHFLPPLLCCSVVAIGIAALPKAFDSYWWVECAIGFIVLGLCFCFFERQIATMALKFAHKTIL